MSESESTTSWEYTIYVPNDPRAVTICRQTLRMILAAHGLPHLTEAAELLATELVTNAVQHTKGPAAIRLRAEGTTLRIGVWDSDPTPPRPIRHATPDSESGRGLALVRTCADTWGWVHQRDVRNIVGAGKYVWCECALEAPECIPGRAGRDLEDIPGSNDLPEVERQRGP